MRSNLIEGYKKRLALNKRQKEILVGMLLGDGHLERLYTPILGRLKVEHSHKQRPYVDWLYKEFRNWVRSKPRARIVKAWGKTATNYGFGTYGHRILGDFRRRFYKHRKKIVPNDLGKDITPLGLAVWFMDDGSIKSKRHKGIFLNTQGFSDYDVRKLQKILKNKFAIDSTTKPDKHGKQIYLGGKSGEKFIKLVRPNIISSMVYKIPQSLRLTTLPKK